MMETLNKELQSKLSISEVKQILVDGNKRFVNGESAERNLLQQVNETSTGQFPHTVVLGCIDSRVTAEQIFDLGIGDIFKARVAGNIVNEDILGSMEYGCKVAGSDRKSTRLNSSHVRISYAVFCLKKKNKHK